MESSKRLKYFEKMIRIGNTIAGISLIALLVNTLEKQPLGSPLAIVAIGTFVGGFVVTILGIATEFAVSIRKQKDK
jgi:hypothetical protein